MDELLTLWSMVVFNQSQATTSVSPESENMAADGPNADGGDDFDPRSGDLECTEQHIESELKAPDEKL